MESQAVPVPRKAYAVVATGVMTESGLPKFLLAQNGHTLPVLCFVHDVKVKAERKATTLNRLATRVQLYDSPEMDKSKPFYGVVAVYLPAKKAGKQMSAEQKAALQAGRQKARRSTVPLVPSAKK